MKIRKRHRPAVFGSLTDQIPAHHLSDSSTDPQDADFDPPIVEHVPNSSGRGASPSGPMVTRDSLPPPTRPDARYAPAGRRHHDDDLAIPPAWPIYFTAFVVSTLWVCGPIAFAIGYRGEVVPFHNDLFAMSVFTLLALGPATFVWLAAYFVRQGQRLGVEARRAQSLSEDLTTPVLVAAARTGDVVQTIRDEIVRAGEAAEEARETLLALREALASETERLNDAAASSVRVAQGLASTLGLERTEMNALAQTLDTQATRVSDVITQQARMVAEASNLAETQLREAEASLAARAADLAAAAAEASGAARTAGEDLNRHVARLENAGIGVAEQIRTVENGLGAQRTALVTLVEAIRGEHEGFANLAETHTTQLAEFISQTRLSAVEMGDRAIKGGEALRAMVAEAATQFHELAQAAETGREEFAQSAAGAVTQLSDTAVQERARLEEQTEAAIAALTRAAEETRAAAASHAEAARHHVDQLSEATFAAGQTANKAFESRLDEARQLIEKSAELIDQAGAQTARKLEDGAAAARTALEELQRMLSDVEERAVALPAAARGQADQVRAAVTGSMDELIEQARRAAAETQAIDEAFQGRVRRNYEMLSEAVRLMGSVAVAGGVQSAPSVPYRSEPPPEPPPLAATAAPVRKVEPEDMPARPPAPIAKQGPAGPRARLRLTPTATDEEFTSIFESSGGKASDEPGDGDGWTWKDLLSSIDEAESSDPARLQDALVSEIAGMGIDPAVLLPTAKIEELAANIQTGDFEGAREALRTIAPAANRRVARRLFTDEKLKRQALTFLSRYKDQLVEAAERDSQGAEVASLLNTDAGRAYLVLDAAAGDIA